MAMLPEKVTEHTVTREEIIALFHGDLRLALESLPASVSIMTLDEIEAQRVPNENDYLMRRNLWREVDQARKSGETKIDAVDIFGSVCSKQAFTKVLQNPLRLAWLLIPPQQDIDRMRNILDMSLGRLSRTMATIDINEKSLGHYLKALDMLMNRVLGPVVQRLDARHATVNLNKPIQGNIDGLNQIEELKEQIVQRTVKEIDSGGAV